MIDLLIITAGVAAYMFIGSVIMRVTIPLWRPKDNPMSDEFVAVASMLWPMVLILYVVVLYFIVVVALPMKAAEYVTSRETEQPVPPMER